MPQMSPCSWLMLLGISNCMFYIMKTTLFFEKKC